MTAEELATIVARDAAWDGLRRAYDGAADRRHLLALVREMHTQLVYAHDHHGIECTPAKCDLLALLRRLDPLLPSSDDVRGILA